MRHPYIKYSMFALLSQIGIWMFFSLCDWAFDEHHLLDNEMLIEFSGYITIAVIVFLPLILYFCMKKPHFSTDSPIIDSIFHIIVWSICAFVITCPACSLIESGQWIVPQEYHHSGFIDLNGIEYLLIPMVQLLIAGVLVVFSLFPAIVRKILSAKQ